jgi:hypothetical protein
MVVNFHDHPTEVNVGREVDPVIIIGEIEVAGDVVRLGPQSALAADATQQRLFSAPRHAAAALRGSS